MWYSRFQFLLMTSVANWHTWVPGFKSHLIQVENWILELLIHMSKFSSSYLFYEKINYILKRLIISYLYNVKKQKNINTLACNWFRWENDISINNIYSLNHFNYIFFSFWDQNHFFFRIEFWKNKIILILNVKYMFKK